VPWQGLLCRRLAVQVVPGQCLHHTGAISYHGHHLLFGHCKVQILPLEHGVTDLSLSFPKGAGGHSDPIPQMWEGWS
jgi:hypothetical protein